VFAAAASISGTVPGVPSPAVCFVLRFRRQKNASSPPKAASTTAGITTPIATFAPVDSPEEESLVAEESEDGSEVLVAVMKLPLPLYDATPDADVGTSLASYTIRTPYANSPLPLVKVDPTVCVLPLGDWVIDKTVCVVAVHSQKYVDQMPVRVVPPRMHSSVMPARVGQQTTEVVLGLAPVP
jgi:hypothetical protein